MERPEDEPNEENGRVLVELVRLAVCLVVDLAPKGWHNEHSVVPITPAAPFSPDGIVEVELTIHHVGPCRRVGILEIGHERLGSRVQRIDDHLPVRRSRNFDPSVLEARTRRRASPRGSGSNGLCLLEESELGVAAVELLL